MDKSVHLVTLEQLQTALSSFDMSFGVSNRLFRLAIVSEILDATCLFEQLLESWKQCLPFGEGPDADVDFDYWKDLSSWEELQSNAQQNVCIDNYPLDMGNGLSSEYMLGKRRKSYLKYLKAALKSANYPESMSVVELAKLLANDNSGMMTFGNMVFSAILSLHSVLDEIQSFLLNPPEELFQSYYEQQKGRFSNEIEVSINKTKDIMHESISEKRKVNRLKEMRDVIVESFHESGFLNGLKKAYTHYDIDDYRKEHNCKNLSDNIVLDRLVLIDLSTDDRQFDKKKIAKYIYEQRKTMKKEVVLSFFNYVELVPEIERLINVLKGFGNEYDLSDKEQEVGSENSKQDNNGFIIQTINVQGDMVLQKKVDNEVGNVESGATGINVNKDEK